MSKELKKKEEELDRLEEEVELELFRLTFGAIIKIWIVLNAEKNVIVIL